MANPINHQSSFPKMREIVLDWAIKILTNRRIQINRMDPIHMERPPYQRKVYI